MRLKYKRLEVGQKIGRWTILEECPLRNSVRFFLCQCTCGTKRAIREADMHRGHTKSCGCGRIKHGHARGVHRSPEYRVWNGMLNRCKNPNNSSFNDYGKRGITVCERWCGEHGFENFLVDMGMRPIGTSLDRRNVNGKYELSNCRWATAKEQSNNRRKFVCLDKFTDEELQNEIWKRTPEYGIGIAC